MNYSDKEFQINAHICKKSLKYLSMALIVVGAVLLQRLGSRLGIGLSPDSGKYVRYAKTILGDEPAPLPGQIRDYLVHYPPLYPTLIAFVSRFFRNIYESCRIIQTCLFGANVLLVASICGWLAPAHRRWIVPSIAAVATIGLKPIVVVHLWAWSEPLFIFLLLITLCALASDCRSRLLFCLLTVSASTIVMTRYAGLAIVPTAVLSVYLNERKWYQSRSPLRQSLRPLALIGFVAVMLGALFWHNRSVAGTATNREFGNYSTLNLRLSEAARSVFEWFYPLTASDETSLLVGAILIVATTTICALLALKIFASKDMVMNGEPKLLRRQKEWLMFSFIFVCAYIALLLISIKFIDPLTPLDDRILSPVAILLLINIIVIANIFTTRAGSLVLAAHKTMVVGIAAVVIVICSASAFATCKELNIAASNGLGYRSRWWRHSGLKEAVSMISRDAKIYTNDPEGVYVLSGRLSTGIIAQSPSVSMPQYAMQVDKQKHQLQAAQGYVLYIIKKWSDHKARFDISLSGLQAEFDLHPLCSFTHVILMRYTDDSKKLKRQPTSHHALTCTGW